MQIVFEKNDMLNCLCFTNKACVKGMTMKLNV
jgi:hypothetical protein